MRRKCVLNWGTLDYYPNMYVVLVAPSGKARKGTAMGPGLDFLQDIGVKLAAEAITREALIRELRESHDTTINPEKGSYISHCSLTVFSQELTVFLGYHNRQLMSDLTDWYDCRKQWKYRTKHFGEDDIKGVWVNLIGATTPELIQSSMPMDAIGGGLTSRMIFVYEPRKGKTVPDPFLSQAEIQLRHQLLLDLEKIAMMNGKFRFTNEFIAGWHNWYTQQEEREPPVKDPRFGGYIERRPTHVMKLSMICSASEGDDMILTLDHLERAIRILEMTERKMHMVFAGFGKSQAADLITKMIIEIGLRKEIDLAEFYGMFYYDADKRTIDATIDHLESMKVLTKLKTPQTTILKYIGEAGKASPLIND